MGYAEGVGWSVSAACAHTAIDVLRKHGSTKIPPAILVALISIFDAVIATTVWCAEHAVRGVGLELLSGQYKDGRTFVLAACISSALLLASKLLYQQALHIAPLSLTVPYLAFTPAILVLVAYIFIGEVPTPMGLLGVLIVTISGYLLGSLSPPVEPGSPSKRKAGAEISTLAALTWAGPALTKSASAASLAAAAAAALGDSERPSLRVSLPATSTTHSAWALSFHKERRSHQPYIADEEQPLLKPSVSLPHPPAAQQLLSNDKPPPTQPPTSSIAAAAAAAGRLAATWWRVIGFPASLRQPPPRLGPVIVLCVAAIWSVTASLDKIGIMAAPSMGTYFVAQRLLIGAAGLTYMLCCARRSLRYCCSQFWLLCSISLLEQAAVLFFLFAINNILVSYVVAIKRINVLFSTVLACLVFQERVVHRLPYILLMLCGMLLIVLQPGHENLDHNHHTMLR